MNHQKIVTLFHLRPIKQWGITILASLKDTYRYLGHSNTLYRYNNAQKMRSGLARGYHSIEKGLTADSVRLGFGADVVRELIQLCGLYISKNFDKKSLEIVHSVNVLNEYITFHQQNSFALDPTILQGVMKLECEIELYKTKTQREVSKKEFYRETQLQFDQFCMSRRSVRNFTAEDIPLTILNKCIDLALSSPSSCNRQPSRVYIIKNAEKKEAVLKLQNGYRGFAHSANTLLVITSDISAFDGWSERNESHLSAGMFSMTLMYALHYFNIGCCPINCAVVLSKDKKMRSLIGIPENESINLIVACGYIPEKISITASPRLTSNCITQEIL